MKIKAIVVCLAVVAIAVAACLSFSWRKEASPADSQSKEGKPAAKIAEPKRGKAVVGKRAAKPSKKADKTTAKKAKRKPEAVSTVTVSVSVALGAAGLFSKTTVVADDEHVLQMGDNDVVITGNDPVAYEFTPEETGYYQFLSDHSSAPDLNPYASLRTIVYGEDYYLAYDSNSGGDWNFQIM